MEQDEIYRELHLRGYNYRGLFKGIINTDVTGSVGAIKWEGNWVTFIDKLIQMKILQNDAHLNPVEIKRIEIDSVIHNKIVKGFSDNETVFLPAYANREANLIK